MSERMSGIDDKGRCCGRKPIHYKGGSWRYSGPPKLFCDRCCREYDPETLEQRANWAWVQNENRLAMSLTHALAEANSAPIWGERT
jgi:hypothetical protein